MGVAGQIDSNLPSERSFGLVLAAAFAILGLWPLLNGGLPRSWALTISVGLIGVGLVVPAALRIPNILWLKIGTLLGRIVSPIVMLVLFMLVFLPMALVLSACRKDLLHLRFDPTAESYWIDRDSAEEASQTMKNQF